MKVSDVGGAPERGRFLNAVALQNAVLCAECEVVSDSPHDQCLVCGSRSLFNIARMLGGSLPRNRAIVLKPRPLERRTPQLLIGFATAHQVRRKVAG